MSLFSFYKQSPAQTLCSDDKQTIEAILVDELGHGVPDKSVNLYLDDVLYTNTVTDEEGKALLESFNFPFRTHASK